MGEYFTGRFAPTAATNPANPTFAAAGAVPYGAEAANINQFMTGQAVAPFAANLPGYANMVGQRSENTGQMLAGQLPNDVVSQIAQQAAERGVLTGSPGSPNANAAFLRSIGLNSLDMMLKGSEQLSTSIADTPVPELWNPTALWVPTVLGQQEASAASAARAAEERAQREAENRAQNEAISKAWEADWGRRNSTQWSWGMMR